ncbi:MAG: outer membrane protein [Rhodoblastus sp.]
MSRILRPLLGVSLLALSAGTALAADLPSRKAPPPVVYAPPPPVFTWTGLYAGVNAGAAISDRRFDIEPFGGSASPNGVAFTGGGQIGYNWQTGPLVLGVETDINYRGSSGSSGGYYGGLGSRSGYFGTARARIGYAFDRVLLYGAGGLAYGNVEFPGSAAVGPYMLSGFGNSGGVKAGWTAGAGVEYAITPKWSVKAEYLYVDLGRNSANYVDIPTAMPVTLRSRNSDHVARVGVNYHF